MSPNNPAKEPADVAGLIDSWTSEKQSSFLYRVLAETETEGLKKSLFAQLIDEAEAQAQTWEREIQARGGQVPADFRVSGRVRLAAALVRRWGARRSLPMLAALKVRGLSAYRAAAPDHPMPTAVGPEGGRHRGVDSGGSLRAAVFGVNDGLVSNLSLILGVAGAAQEPKTVLLAGVAGLLAGAFSMAAGEYISMRSQRELFEYQIGLEREELALYPEQEAEELALIYQARGVPRAEARTLADKLLQNPEHALDTLAREELGLNPDELGSPWGAAVSSLLAFGVGGIIPLSPLLFGATTLAVPLAAGFGILGLFVVGAALSLFTGRQAWWSGLRMVLIGGGAALTTFLIGKWLGVNLS
jgi:VIT1/CCC1 family predicted Fe2+/Mn2+ transporter